MLKRYCRELLTLLALALTLGVYGYYAYITLDIHNTDLHRQLGESFLAGHTYLQREPAPQLAALADPYAPEQNGPYQWQDISYYQGKFYVYFGAAPTVIVWIPVYVLTGHSLSDGGIACILTLAGILCLFALFYLMVRREQIAQPLGLFLALLGIGLGSGIPFIMREPVFYVTAIACAFGFSAMGALCLWIFLVQKRYRWMWLGSLFLGLAAGSRIIHLANILLLAGVWLHAVRQSRSKSVLAKTTLACLPYALCLIVIGWYNYVRFGNPFDIGWRYVLTLLYNMHSPDFHAIRPRLWLTNLYYYLLKPLHWSGHSTFPWFTKPDTSLPWNAFIPWQREMVLGMWTNSPFSLWFLAYIGWMSRRRSWHPASYACAAGLGAYTLAVFAFLMVYFFCTQRYVVDFAPFMVTLAGLGYMKTLDRSPHPRRWLWIGGIMVAYSVFTGVVAGYGSYGFWPN